MVSCWRISYALAAEFAYGAPARPAARRGPSVQGEPRLLGPPSSFPRDSFLDIYTYFFPFLTLDTGPGK